MMMMKMAITVTTKAATPAPIPSFTDASWFFDIAANMSQKIHTQCSFGAEQNNATLVLQRLTCQKLFTGLTRTVTVLVFSSLKGASLLREIKTNKIKTLILSSQGTDNKHILSQCLKQTST